jgi:hypothetical protein
MARHLERHGWRVLGVAREKYRCPECGSAAVNAQGHKDRVLRSLPIGGKRPLEKFAFVITGQFAIEFAAEGAEFFVEELDDVKMMEDVDGLGKVVADGADIGLRHVAGDGPPRLVSTLPSHSNRKASDS